MNILVSSAGRRLQLIECFREAMRDCGVSGGVFAVDSSPYAPAFHLADAAWYIPRCDSPEYIPELLAVAERERIDVIVPTIDSELEPLANHRRLFASRGIHVCVSDPATVLIAEDKWATHRWLTSEGFPTVGQWSPEELLDGGASQEFPVIAKPRRGSASNGLRRIRSRDELYAYASVENDLIVQAIAEGLEYTTNLFVNRGGKCVWAIPHQRMEVRGGEVSKAVTVRHEGLMRVTRQIAEALPGAHGPLNIQCFLSPAGDIRVIEINARVGGGYPLAHRAGGKSTHWIVQEALGLSSASSVDDWTDNLVMLRYDQAVFKSASDIQTAIDRSAAVSGVGS